MMTIKAMLCVAVLSLMVDVAAAAQLDASYGILRKFTSHRVGEDAHESYNFFIRKVSEAGAEGAIVSGRDVKELYDVQVPAKVYRELCQVTAKLIDSFDLQAVVHKEKRMVGDYHTIGITTGRAQLRVDVLDPNEKQEVLLRRLDDLLDPYVARGIKQPVSEP